MKRPPGGRRQFIDSVGWQSSTSEEYREMPHQYTIKHRAMVGKPVPNPEWFEWFVYMIRKHGYKAKFTNTNTGSVSTYTYMDAQDGTGDWAKYWVMPKPPVIGINREPLPGPRVAGRSGQPSKFVGGPPDEEHP